MQNLDPTGEYTDAEVKAALSGATGSRDWSFRYARLDSNNNYIEDVDYIQSCTVENNFLADIKRTAKFSILDTGNINYLQDRIQPFARLNMPVASSTDYSSIIDAMHPTARYTMNGTTLGRTTVFDYYTSPTNGGSFATAVNAGGHYSTMTRIAGTSNSASATYPAESWTYVDVVGYTPIIFTAWGNAGTISELYFQSGTLQSDLTLLDTATSLQYSPAELAGGLNYVIKSPVNGRYYFRQYLSDQTKTDTPNVSIERGSTIGDSVGGRALVASGLSTFGSSLINDGGTGLVGTSGVVGNAVNHTVIPQTTDISANDGPLYNGSFSINAWSQTTSKTFGTGTLGNTVFAATAYIGTKRIKISLESDTSITSRLVVSSDSTGNEFSTLTGILSSELIGTHNITFAVSSDSTLSNFSVQLVVDGASLGTLTLAYWSSLLPEIGAGAYFNSVKFETEGHGSLDDITVFKGRTLSVDDSISITQAGLNAKPSRRGYVEWPQGVFILSSPKRTMLEGNTVVREVDAYDQLLALSEDSFDSRYTIPAGANCVKEIINITGEQTRKNLVLSPLSGAYNNSGSAWATTSGAGYTSSLSTTNVHGSAIDSIALTSSGSVFPAYLGAGFTISTPDAVGKTITYSIWVKSATAISVYPIIYMIDSTQRLYGTSQASTTTTLVPNVWTKITFTGYIDNVPASSFGVGITGYYTASGQTLYLSDPIAEVGTTVGTEFSGSTSDSATTSYTWSGSVGNSVSLASSKAINIVSTTKTFAQAMEWEPGTTKLKVINDILAYINYDSAWFDENGVLIGRPYISPSDRGAEFTYATDSDSVITGDIDQTVDLFKIPNKWVLVVSNPESTPLIGSYTNDNPLSPTSTISRGRTIVDYRTEQNAADQVTLDAKAARLAFEASQVYEKVDFNTGIMPIHSNSDVYNLIIDGLVIDNKYSETSWSMDLDPGSAMKHSVRRITSV